MNGLNKPWSVSKIRKFANNFHLTFLGKKNLGSHAKHEFKCKICNAKFEISLTNLSQRPRCPKCSKRRAGEKNRTSIARIRHFASLINADLQISVYEPRVPLRLRCISCGETFQNTLGGIKTLIRRSPKRPGDCRHQKILKLEGFKSFENVWGIRALRKERNSSNGRMVVVWQCLFSDCGHVFRRDIDAIRRSPGCERCKVKNIGEELCRLSFEILFDAPFPNVFVPWLREEPKGRMRSLDGYNESLGIAFEHHGLQHFKEVAHFHRAKGAYDRQRAKDELRQKLCSKHNVRLVIVPDLVNLEGVLNRDYSNGYLIPIPPAILAACSAAGIRLPPGYKNLRIDVRKLARRDNSEIISSLQIAADKKRYTLSGVYIGNKSKLIAACWDCGYKWPISPSKIKQRSGSSGCPQCAGNIPISYTKIVTTAKNYNHSINLDQKTFKNSQQRISVKCSKCDRVRNTIVTRYLNSPDCHICSRKLSSRALDKKRMIMDFFQTENRLPKSSGNKKEKGLYLLLCSYCSPKKAQYDPQFHKWAIDHGYGGKNHRWTKDECWSLAKKCKTKVEFQRKYRKAYDSSLNNGWWNEINGHFQPIKSLTRERCKTAFDNCLDKRKFYLECPSEYEKASRMGWLGDFLADAGLEGHKKKVICRETGKEYGSTADAARDLGIHPANINAVLKGRRKTTGGFSFKYQKG